MLLFGRADKLRDRAVAFGFSFFFCYAFNSSFLRLLGTTSAPIQRWRKRHRGEISWEIAQLLPVVSYNAQVCLVKISRSERATKIYGTIPFLTQKNSRCCYLGRLFVFFFCIITLSVDIFWSPPNRRNSHISLYIRTITQHCRVSKNILMFILIFRYFSRSNSFEK